MCALIWRLRCKNIEYPDHFGIKSLVPPPSSFSFVAHFHNDALNKNILLNNVHQLNGFKTSNKKPDITSSSSALKIEPINQRWLIGSKICRPVFCHFEALNYLLETYCRLSYSYMFLYHIFNFADCTILTTGAWTADFLFIIDCTEDKELIDIY